MDLGLKGKTVIVVGGSSNLGRACAVNLAQEGANVVIASRKQKNIDKVIDAIKGMNVEGKVVGYAFDAESLDQSKKLAQDIKKQFGKIESLVMSLGFSEHREFLEIPPEHWQPTLNSNINTVLNCVYSVLPIMIEQKSGNMVVMSSVLGRRGCAEEAVYSGTKAYVKNLFQSLVLGYSQYGLRFNCIAPAFTLDDNWDNYSDESLWVKAFSKDDIAEMIPQFGGWSPMGDIAKADDVGKACVFFVSDILSRHVTGNTIGTDGGIFMGS